MEDDSLVAQAPSLIGRVVAGRYRVERQIGQGGMGAIFLATQEPLGRQIVLKVLLDAFAHDEVAVARFEKEALSISRLVHPNIVTLFDFGRTEEGELFIAMEFLSGRSLREVLYHDGALPWQRAVRVITGIAQGLAEAHRHDIIHRDLKPENIMLVRSGEDHEFPKVLDFGLARSLDASNEEFERVTQQNMIPGTPAYIAPERVNGLDDDVRSDLYSLGAMWFELVTGEIPFDAPTPIKIIVKHLQEAPRRPSQVVPHNAMPPALEEQLLALLAKRSEDRPPSASALLRIIQPFASGEAWEAARGDELSDPGRPAPMLPSAAHSLKAWAEEASEIPDLDFGSALGLVEEEPMLLTTPKSGAVSRAAIIAAGAQAPIELTRRKDIVGPDVLGAIPDFLEPLQQGLISQPALDLATAAGSPPLRDTRDTPRPAAASTRPPPTAKPGPLSSIAEAATQLATCRTASELGLILVSYLQWKFARSVVLDLRPVPFRVLASEGVGDLDEPVLIFAPARGFWALVRERQPYYGPPPDGAEWDKLFEHLGGQRPGAIFVATLRRAGTPALTIFAAHDQPDLYPDLRDTAVLLKEAAAAMSIIAD